MPSANPNPTRPRKPAIPTAELLTLLADADCCFTEVAQRCSITVEELSIYLMSDEGSELFMAAQSAAMMRVRLAATSNLNHAVSALSLMLMTYQSESETLFRDSPPTRKFREIQRVNARRAASLLTRLANLQYRPLIAPQTTRPESPSPRDWFGVGATNTSASNYTAPSTSTRPESPSPRDWFGVGATNTSASNYTAPSTSTRPESPSPRDWFGVGATNTSASNYTAPSTSTPPESPSPREGFGVGETVTTGPNPSATRPPAASRITAGLRTPIIPASITSPTCRSP